MHFPKTIPSLKDGCSRGVRLFVAFLAVSILAIAHNGFVHISGTITRVEANMLTVETENGTTDILLNEQTEFLEDTTPATVADLAAGTHIVADIPEDSDSGIAAKVHIQADAPMHGSAAEPEEHQEDPQRGQ